MSVKKRRYLIVNSYNFGSNNLFYLWYNFHGSFFNTLMKHGFKIFAFNRFILIKEELKLKEKGDPYLIFLVALMKISPKLKLQQMKMFSINIKLPLPVTQKKGIVLAVKWALKLLKNKKWSIKVSTIVDHLISTIYNKGIAVEKIHTLNSSGALFIDSILNKRQLGRRRISLYK